MTYPASNLHSSISSLASTSASLIAGSVGGASGAGGAAGAGAVRGWDGSGVPAGGVADEDEDDDKEERLLVVGIGGGVMSATGRRSGSSRSVSSVAKHRPCVPGSSIYAHVHFAASNLRASKINGISVLSYHINQLYVAGDRSALQRVGIDRLIHYSQRI